MSCESHKETSNLKMEKYMAMHLNATTKKNVKSNKKMDEIEILNEKMSQIYKQL